MNNEKLDKAINRAFTIPENNDIEFRLYTNPLLTWGKTVFVMRQKNNIWEAHLFRGEPKNIWSVEDVNNNGLDILWSKLVQNQVLTLPDQNVIKKRMKTFDADTTNVLKDRGHSITVISDGAIYKFELTSYYRKRAYSYHCPHAYSKAYPNIEELYRAYAIIILVYNHIGLPLSSVA